MFGACRWKSSSLSVISTFSCVVSQNCPVTATPFSKDTQLEEAHREITRLTTIIAGLSTDFLNAEMMKPSNDYNRGYQDGLIVNGALIEELKSRCEMNRRNWAKYARWHEKLMKLPE
jgi:hypothetical protein